MGFSHRMLATYLERYLPPGVVEPEERRCGILTLLVIPALGIWLPVFVAAYAAFRAWIAAATLFVLMVAFAITPELYRRTGSRGLAVNTLVGGCIAAAAIIACLTGGFRSPVMEWMIGFPFIAVLLTSLRVGAVWLAITGVIGSSLAILEWTGTRFPNHLPPGATEVIGILSFPGVATMMFLLAWGFESTKNRMLSKLETSKARAEKAHRDVRLVLDNMHHGLVLVDAAGVPRGAPSKRAMELLGPFPDDEPFWAAWASSDLELGEWFRLAWPSLSDPHVPPEVALSQLPPRFEFGSKSFGVRCQPIEEDGRFGGAVLSFEDLSARVEAQAAKRREREWQRLAFRVLRDPSGMRAFLEEGARILASIESPGTEDTTRIRLLHTLKGNAGLLGLEELNGLCHALETALTKQEGSFGPSEARSLSAGWRAVVSRVESLLEQTSELQVSEKDHRELLASIAAGEARTEIYRRVEAWLDEPVARRLELLAEQAQALARRLGKSPIRTEVETGPLRLPARQYAPFWAVMAHVVRNAIDHGIETVPVRIRAGKPPEGLLRLHAETIDGWGFRLCVSDDGAGIDWATLRVRAREQGIRGSDEELVFAEGISASPEVTAVSGRGIGAAAVRDTLRTLGGQVAIRSAPGQGTTWVFTLPIQSGARAGTETSQEVGDEDERAIGLSRFSTQP